MSILPLGFEPLFLPALGALALLALALIAMREHRVARTLRRLLDQKSALIEKTAKMLVEKNIELSDQNLHLERTLEAKNDFIGVASHQLRTPITEIAWAIEDMLDGTYDTLTEPQILQMQSVLGSAKKLTRLIGELLHFVESDAGFRGYRIAPTDSGRLLTDLLDDAQKRFPEKNISLERSLAFGATPLSVDADMLTIAIGNVVDNAYRYTLNGGTIRVSTERIGDSFVCTIADSGIGIPPEKYNDIFKKFRRSREALSLHSSGVGLGLYISKNIIEQHGGTITFESEIGKGTAFRITLPLVPTSR